MLRSGSLTLALLALAATGLHAETAVNTDKINKKIDRVALLTVDGKPATLDPVAGHPKATVVIFLSFECPVSNSYSTLLAKLHKDFTAKGVRFYGIVSSTDAPAAIRKQADEFQLPFPIFIDPKQVAVEAFKAQVTPEAFVLDHNQVLRYRGRIDSSWAARLKRNVAIKVESNLQNAVEELLAGKPVAVPATEPVGCPVTAKLPAATAEDMTVTYHRDVVPILQAQCQECHRPGQVGPFSLLTYKQALNWADDMKEYTQTRRMPPWKPLGGPEYAHERKLTDAQIKTIAHWVDAGCPEGNLKDAPAPVKFPEGWRLGKPDLILSVENDFYLDAAGSDTFRCFVMPTGLTEDKYIVGFEVQPGNPRVVHHTLNFWDATGRARELQKEQAERDAKSGAKDHGPGYSVGMGLGFLPDASRVKRAGIPPIGGFGGWAPGQLPHFLPGDAGYFLPKGTDIVMQVHYHRDGKPEKDKTQIGLYFAKKPVTRPWQSLVIGGMSPLTFIAPGKADYVAKGSAWAASDFTLYNAMPHMHLIGRKVKITMTRPGSATETLVEIPEWDYNWQETYWFKEPMKIAAGTRFDIEAVYDNSEKNPNNPRNPPGWVRFGEETTNEMLFGFLGGITESGRLRGSRRDPSAPAPAPKDAKGDVKPEKK